MSKPPTRDEFIEPIEVIQITPGGLVELFQLPPPRRVELLAENESIPIIPQRVSSSRSTRTSPAS